MEYIKLGEVISSAKTERCGVNDYPILSITKSDGVILQSDKFKKRIASTDTEQYKLVKCGQLVQGIHIDEANFGIQSIVDTGIVSPAYKIWNVDFQKIVPKYLETVLRSPRSVRYYASKFNGSVKRRERIADDDFLAMEIPLPSKEQQQYAVVVLEKASSLITLYQQQLQKLDDLVKARFVELFGDYLKDDRKPLSEVAIITGGLTKNSNRNTFETKMPYLRVANVFYNRLDLREILEIGVKEEEIGKTLLQAGDLLFVEGNGSIEQIGRVAIWDGSIDPILHQNHLIKARFDNKTIMPEFALFYFMSQEGRQQIISKSVSTSGLNTLSVNKISSLTMPIPPIAIQKQFGEFIKQTDKSKVVIQKSIACTLSAQRTRWAPLPKGEARTRCVICSDSVF